jgi:hypothetical protein
MANPSVVDTDKSDNWSDETVLTDLTVGYTTTKSDTTMWQVKSLECQVLERY